MLKLNFIPVVLILSLGIARAQSFICGTTGDLAEPIAEQLRLHKKTIEENGVVYPRSTIYLAVKFHLVARKDGTGRVSEQNVLTQLCTLNEDFADQNIQFYLDGGFNYINDDQTYNDHFADDQFTVMINNKDLDAINIYIIENIDSGSQLQAYYTRSFDWIVISNDQIGAAHTLTHEIGHFLGLLHPFHGWDRDPYEPAKHGSPAPEKTTRGVLVERADGSNCNDAGDMICDTPADYAFRYPRSNCTFEDVVLDPSSAPIDPDERLFMNYFKCSRKDYYFTDQQKEIMMIELMSSTRFAIRDDVPNSTAIVNQLPEIISPKANESISTNSVVLKWTDTPNATHYLVEVDISPNFASDLRQSFVTEINELFIAGLSPSRLHFWRITPYNEYSSCTGSTNRSAFKTGVVTQTNYIAAVDNWSVAPNPVQSNTPVYIQLESSANFQANVSLFNVSGSRVLQPIPFPIKRGVNEMKLFLEGQLEAGIYLIQIQSHLGMLSQRIMVY